MADEKLDDIRNLLEDIKQLLIVTNHDKIEEMKKKLLKKDSLEEKIYKLCDGINTTTDIAGKIQKGNEYTGAVISTLREKGLIKTIKKNTKNVHERIF